MEVGFCFFSPKEGNDFRVPKNRAGRQVHFPFLQQIEPHRQPAAQRARSATRAHGTWQEEADDGGRVRAHERGRRVVLGPVRPGGAVAQAQADGLAAPAGSTTTRSATPRTSTTGGSARASPTSWPGARPRGAPACRSQSASGIVGELLSVSLVR